jgi:hypothetical protein
VNETLSIACLEFAAARIVIDTHTTMFILPINRHFLHCHLTLFSSNVMLAVFL